MVHRKNARIFIYLIIGFVKRKNSPHIWFLCLFDGIVVFGMLGISFKWEETCLLHSKPTMWYTAKNNRIIKGILCQVENVSVFKLECQRKKIQQYRQRYQHATHIANKHIKRNYEHQILEFMRNRKEFRTQQRISEASNNIERTDRTTKNKIFHGHIQ